MPACLFARRDTGGGRIRSKCRIGFGAADGYWSQEQNEVSEIERYRGLTDLTGKLKNEQSNSRDIYARLGKFLLEARGGREL